MPRLSELTTLRLGGPAGRMLACSSEDALVAAVRDADVVGEPVLVLGGGSNLVVADTGFPGAVVRVLTRGFKVWDSGGQRMLEVVAGEPWDALVGRCVEEGLAGFECLSGIPGLVGATPIQNVGAYGQDVAETIVWVRVYDRERREVRALAPGECGFGYRTSIFKRIPGRWLVLAVTFALERGEMSQPIRYAELGRALGVDQGETAPLGDVRDAVLRLRRAKGMVLDPDDPDTVSAGSFFLNPILCSQEWERFLERVADRLGGDARPPAFPQSDGNVKTSAAWLIERAGFRRGYGDPDGIALSSKHTLALTNRGHGTTSELLSLAREIVDGVQEAFGVELHPEPVIVGERL